MQGGSWGYPRTALHHGITAAAAGVKQQQAAARHLVCWLQQARSSVMGLLVQLCGIWTCFSTRLVGGWQGTEACLCCLHVKGVLWLAGAGARIGAMLGMAPSCDTRGPCNIGVPLNDAAAYAQLCIVWEE